MSASRSRDLRRSLQRRWKLLRDILELILLAVFVALWLGPFVEFFTRRRVPRVVAILGAYLTLFLSILVIGLVAVPPIVKQINAGVRQLPTDISKVSDLQF